MARQVLPLVGAAVGAFFGNPQLGWMIGSYLGNAVDPQTIRGPSIGDIAQQTAQEGGPRPIVFALSSPIAGNIIASGEPVIVHKSERQGKGGPKVETESVYRTYAIGVCEGTKQLVRAWRNSQLVYDISDTSQLSDEDNAHFLDTARWFDGSFDQEPSPDLEAIFGVGTTPAHRGTAYMVRADEDLTDLRGSIPQWQFQVGDSAVALYPDPILLLRFEDQPDGSTTFVDTSPLGHTPITSSGTIAIDTDETKAICGAGTAVGASGRISVPHNAVFNPGSDDFTISLWVKVESVSIASAFTLFEKIGFTTLYPYKINCEPTGTVSALGAVGAGESWPAGNSAFSCGTAIDITDAEWHHIALERWGAIFTLFVDGVGHADNGNPLTDPPIVPGTFFGNLASNSEPVRVAQTASPGVRYDDIYMTNQALYHAQDFTPPGCIDQTSLSLADVVAAICERAGVPASMIDVSELTDQNVSGFVVTNTYPAAEALRALSQVYFFDPANFDAAIHFVRRGANSVATITEAEMLEDEEDIEQQKRGDAISIARVLHLNYYDVAGALATNKQTSERAGDWRASGEQSLQSAVVMEADMAARAVLINHKVMAEAQGGELRFRLPDSFLALAPSDPVIVQWQGQSVRAMISRIDLQDGFQEYTLVRDRQSAYTSNIEGIPPPPSSAPPSNVVGPTLIEPLDIHILQDADDGAGLTYYVAISGVTEAWQGAEVELSFDGGANYIDAASSRSAAIMGSLTTELADHPQAFPDEAHSVSVHIETPFAELEATDFAGLLNRRNLALIGDEIVQFAEAEEVSEGIWQLSYLLRGRKGTETAAHAIGERFVLLERGALTMVPAGLADIGRTFTFRATSFGTTSDTGTVVSMLYTGRSQIEREPGYVRARRDGSNAIVDWQGVGRLGAGAAAAHGVRFAGYRVTFEGATGETPIAVDTDEQSLTQDISALSSPVSISVQQLNDLTDAGPAIEVILI